MFAEIVHRYLLVNIPDLWTRFSIFWNPVMIFSRFFLLFTILLFSHYFRFKRYKKGFTIIYSIITAACFCFSLVMYISEGMKASLVNSIPDYIYFVLIVGIILSGLINIVRLKQTGSEFLFSLEYSFLKKVVIVFSVSSPLILNDDCSFIQTPLRFSPLIYSFFSILMFCYIFKAYRTAEYFDKHKNPLKSNLIQKYCITEREQEIIDLVLKGYSNKQIGEKLFISLSTVKSHIYKIYKKVGVKSRYEIMKFFQSD